LSCVYSWPHLSSSCCDHLPDLLFIFGSNLSLSDLSLVVEYDGMETQYVYGDYGTDIKKRPSLCTDFLEIDGELRSERGGGEER
jgi:hypothetical protein